jgi:succinyl-CoA synthetase beta subunit
MNLHLDMMRTLPHRAAAVVGDDGDDAQVGVKVPLVVRLEGTNVEKGKEILRTSGVSIVAADDLDDAAKKAVAQIKK